MSDTRWRKRARGFVGRAMLASMLAFAGAATAEDIVAPQDPGSGVAERHTDKIGAVPMTGDLDYDFATMMRKHHQDGIEMAKNELKNGKDTTMQALARKIVDAQQKEVAEINEWLSTHAIPAPHKGEKTAP